MKKTREGLGDALADCEKFCETGVSDSPWIASALDYLLDGVNKRRILDVGCGSAEGEYAPYLCRTLSKQGSDVTGIDPLIEQSLEKFKCYNLPAEKVLPILPKNRFDAVVTSNFFNCPEFKKDTQPIVKEIYRVLKGGGIYLNSEFDQSQTKKQYFIDLCRKENLNLLFDLYKFNDYLVFKK
jgi:ubiquinone/menaquinone biosynthesis C-methylase UbiE